MKAKAFAQKIADMIARIPIDDAEMQFWICGENGGPATRLRFDALAYDLQGRVRLDMVRQDSGEFLGKPIESMTREELIDALLWALTAYEAERTAHHQVSLARIEQMIIDDRKRRAGPFRF